VFRTITAALIEHLDQPACAAHRSSLDVTLVDRLLASVGLLNRLRNFLIGIAARQPGGKLQPICNANLCVNPAEVTVDGARGQMQCRPNLSARQPFGDQSAYLELTCAKATWCHG
jgi:hypothetical protein